jgi:hypothetical protein
MIIYYHRRTRYAAPRRLKEELIKSEPKKREVNSICGTHLTVTRVHMNSVYAGPTWAVTGPCMNSASYGPEWLREQGFVPR